MSSLITQSGLNQGLLTQNSIKIHESYEDIIEDSERADAGVEETPLTLVCETAYRRGEVAHIEALACSCNGEFRGYKCQLPGRYRQFVVLQGEEPYKEGFSTVGFLNQEGDISSKYRCILARNFKELARLRLSSKDVPSLVQSVEMDQTFNAPAAKRSRSKLSHSSKRRRIDPEPDQDSDSDNDSDSERTRSLSGHEWTGSLTDALRESHSEASNIPTRRQLKRSSMVGNYKKLAGIAPRRSSGSSTNRFASAEDAELTAARAAKIRRARQDETIEKGKKVLEDLRRQVDEATALKKTEDIDRVQTIADQDKERKRLERLLEELRS